MTGPGSLMRAEIAEACSSSEVLHGPLQLVTRPLLVLVPDTGQADV